MTRARPASPPGAPASLSGWAAVCFFVSGAAGLLYEVAWSKQFSYLLGSSLHAVATVVAAFLGGLALGARGLGVPLARRGNGARMYALLELGVAVLGVVSLPVLRGLEPAVGHLYRALHGEGAAFALARFALLFALLIPPTALMGATLPVLVAHFDRGVVGPALARLYALNTFGAVAGSIAGGFALLPGIGLAGTTWVAAGLNAGAALLAAVAGGAGAGPMERARGEPPAPAGAVPVPAGAPRATTGASPRRAALRAGARAAVAAGGLEGGHRLAVALLFALSGFAALAFQIAWVRLFGLVLGSSVYSFSAVLGVYLLGLALGGAAVARRMRRGVTLAGFGCLELALAAAAALEIPLFSRLPDRVYALAERSGPSWGSLFAGEVLTVALLLLVPCALLGAVFPIAARLLQRRDGGHAAGFAYAVNTAGTLAGSLAAGFVLVPALGVQGTHVAALAISGAIGLIAIALARRRRELGGAQLGFGLAAAAVAGAAVAAAPRWDPALMSVGPFRPAQAATLSRVARSAPGLEPPVRRAARTERVLYYREGVNASVYVGTDEQGADRWLRIGGKIDASTGDMQTQVLLGLIPGACADSGARALVVGLGSGITAAAVLAAGAGPTDVVELEPGVVEASSFFHAPGENPLDDRRVRLVLGDARTYLEHGSGRYGLVVSEPSNPWIAGVNNLFTVDFYRRVKRRLEPDGVFCQWMQLYELSPETFKSMVASLLEVFPDGHVFSVWGAVDVLLVAMPDHRALSLRRLESPAARRLLGRAKIPAADLLAGYYAGPLPALRAVVTGAPLNRDDRPLVEYRAPLDMVEVGRAALSGDPKVAALVPFAGAPPAGGLFRDWPAEHWYESRARLLMDRGDIARATATQRAAAAAGLAPLAQRLTAEIAAADRRARELREVEQASELIAAGRNEEGRAALERAVEADPDNAHTWLLLADRRRVAGDLDGALAAIAHGQQSTDPGIRADAMLLSGLVALGRRRPQAALEDFARAQRLNPALARSYLFEAQARQASGDMAGARAALRRGLDHVPADRALAAALAALGAR